MKKILIVNDSPVLTAVIKAVVETNKAYKVVETAANGQQALNVLAVCRPDLVLMDIHMPVMDGVEATRLMIQARPKTRILISSATLNRNMQYIFKALQYGAVDYIHSPSINFKAGTTLSQAQLRQSGKALLSKMHTVFLASLRSNFNSHQPPHVVKKIKHTDMAGGTDRRSTVNPAAENINKIHSPSCSSFVAIGCSTGGPTTVQMLISRLKQPFPVPLLICQHLDEEFTAGFVNWLSETTGLRVMSAKHRSIPEAGIIYVTPGGKMNIEISAAGRFMLVTPRPEHHYLPNINHLFNSLAKNIGKHSIGVVLTGMGNDGAEGIKAIKTAGGKGFAQDSQSAVIDSMPRAARTILKGEMGYSPQLIAEKLNDLFF